MIQPALFTSSFAARRKSAALLLFIVLLFSCGCDNLASRPNVGLVRLLGQLPDPLPIESAEFDREMTRICRVPRRSAESMQLIRNGEQYYPMLFTDIALAKAQVHIVTYILNDDTVGREFARVMCAAAARGVQTRLILDAVGSFNPGVGDVIEQMRKSGVAVKLINPLLGWTILRANNRCHAKIAVIDGNIGYVVGLNMSDKYNGGGLTQNLWRDTGVRGRGEFCSDLEAVFLHLWGESGHGFNRHRIPMPFVDELKRGVQESIAGKGPWPPQNPARPLTGTPVRVLFTGPGWFSHEFYNSMLLVLNSAKESITLEYGYFLPDHPLTLALVNAAKRGVKVRIIMPDRLDIYISKKISLECAQKLCGYGIELYAYRPALLHSKTAVIDGVWTTIGSANINGRSFLLNYECNLTVLNRDFAAEVTASLEEDIRNSRRLTQRDLYPANPLQYIVHKLLYLMKDHM